MLQEGGLGTDRGLAHAGSDRLLIVTGDVESSGNALRVPRQLPLTVGDFTGRAEHLAALDALLTSGSRDQVPGAAVISAVDGSGGIGKTTLAVHWAHRVQDRFPDGTLYANLRGYGPGEPAAPSEILDGFLRAVGTPVDRMPQGLDARAGLYRSLLADRRMLIVLDNANNADQVRPLLPAAPGCMAVVTSRDSLTGLVITEGATRLTLDLFEPSEAHDLVAGVLGASRTAAEPDAVADLVRLCARLPLALRIAAGRVAGMPHTTVAVSSENLPMIASDWMSSAGAVMSVPLCEPCSTGPTNACRQTRRGCSGVWVSMPARTSA